MQLLSFNEFLAAINEAADNNDTCDVIGWNQLKDLEKFADRLLRKFDIDIELTKHFGERMSDSRNKPCIKIAELQQLFKKIERAKGAKIKAHANDQAVLVDIQKDLNIPIVIDVDNKGEFEVRLKTIMRKKNFTTPNPKLTF